MKNLLTLACLLLIGSSLAAQVAILDSGGPILPQQAAYDVHFYDLNLKISPEEQHIAGQLEVRASVVHPLAYFVLDLDTLLHISKVEEKLNSTWVERKVQREVGKVWIPLNHTRQPGASIQLRVHYEGQPRVAPNPPWNGGFSWEKTPSGAHWIATSCQTNGADLWWPCKDHVSDEPDSMALHIQVPDPLVVATNGRLRSVEQKDNWRTYHWFISNPINIYNVALNIAPYQTIEEKEMTSIDGSTYPVIFYVLPEDFAKGQKFFPEILDHLRFFEKLLGPYPFRAEKYGVAQTPHLGMEHQTIIAYGANFSNSAMTGKDWGFDALHHHELAHEWWGNLVTNFDWRDMWLHEGFGSYMQALYIEELSGKAGYRAYMSRSRFFSNRIAVAPLETRSAADIFRAPIYTKGAWVLHNLRYLMGDEAFFKALRRMAYPNPEMEKITDGRQTRFVTTDDFLSICETESGLELDWFFNLYLRQAALPILHSQIEGGTWTLSWETPNDLPFAMPLEVKLNGKIKRVEIPKEGLELQVKEGDQPELDPDGWILMEVKR